MTTYASALRAACLLGVLAVVPGSASLAKTKTGSWEIVQGDFAGRQTCMALGLADQSTFLTLKLDTGHMADHVIALLFMNKNWSIKEGDQLDELYFHAGDVTAGTEPVAATHGFFIYMSLEPAQAWFDKTKVSGFWIERNGKEIARYRGGNLAETFHKITACGDKLIKTDPFADTRQRKPSSTPTELPPFAEPTVTPPKPLNFWPWIKAIETDYFAGPLGGNDIELRHERRNSIPASLRFKLTVDEQGRLAKCEIAASTGLSDWSEEFCLLAERHPLTFTPAVSASGKPVRGEYGASAAVAFE